MLNIQDVEKAINIPAEKWRGRCHEIAAMLLGAGLTDGRLRYGHWLGRVHENSLFNYKYKCKAPIQHGWIERADGTIVDPTRFEFEQVQPYIYEGKNNMCYDAGGNVHRMKTLSPCPAFFAPPEQQLVIYNVEVYNLIKLLEVDFRITNTLAIVTVRQLLWLANLPLQLLGSHAKALYTELVRLQCKAFIPIDNYTNVMEG